MSRTIVFLGLLLPSVASAQATVEAAMGAGRAATMAAPAKSIGKSVSGIGGSLDKALKNGEAGQASVPAASTARPAAKSAVPSAPAPITIREDADGIEEGIPYDELIQRFGKPAMSITMAGEQSLTYKGIAGMYRVTVRDGKVTEIRPPAPPQ
jgi:hypothetical protein